MYRNTEKARCFLWRQNNPEVNYSPTRISSGEGGGIVSGGSITQQGQVAGTCEYGNELPGSIRCGELLDWLQNQLASKEGLCSME